MIAEVYDFCLAWIMESETYDKRELYTQYQSLGLSFDDFKRIAKENNWYVKSMEILKFVPNK